MYGCSVFFMLHCRLQYTFLYTSVALYAWLSHHKYLCWHYHWGSWLPHYQRPWLSHHPRSYLLSRHRRSLFLLLLHLTSTLFWNKKFHNWGPFKARVQVGHTISTLDLAIPYALDHLVSRDHIFFFVSIILLCATMCAKDIFQFAFNFKICFLHCCLVTRILSSGDSSILIHQTKWHLSGLCYTIEPVPFLSCWW